MNDSKHMQTDAIDDLVVRITLIALGLLALWLGIVVLVTVSCRLLRGRARLRALAVARRTMPAWLYRLLIGAVGAGIVLAPVTAGAAPQPLPAPVLPYGTSAPIAPAQAPAESNTAAPQPLPAPVLPTTPARPASQSHGSAGLPAVTVQPGDSLWRIAAAQLGPGATPQAITQQWPRWWAANRAVIGANPDLIRPGQHLVAPGDQP
jgi:nucleoid-associated protein YgaU